MFKEHPERGPVAITDCTGRLRWREEWRGNPVIRQSARPLVPSDPVLRIGRGCCPYHPWSPEVAFRARDYRASLYLTPDELALGLEVVSAYGPFILIEPTGLDRKNPNRRWSGWRDLAAILGEVCEFPILQLDREGADRIPGVTTIPHRSFREACAILQSAHLAVLPEGGLAIGAATVGTPAVVLWGGCVSVETFGYPEHVNLADDGPGTPCESTKPCAHCAAAWARLRPELVAGRVQIALAMQGKAIPWH